jgi:hypothetical protein
MFAIGDRIVRVGDDSRRTGYRHPQGSPQYGQVYCVRDCFRGTTGEWLLMPVGFAPMFNESGKRMGWPAKAFRRVAEVGHPSVATNEQQPA